MKTSVNTMDLRIATAMKEAANVVFEAMPKTQDVNLTALQVYQHFTDAKKVFAGLAKDLEWLANIPASEGDGWNINTDHVITINIDSYSCKCEGIAIFYYLNTFERIAAVKDRTRFVYSLPKSESAKVVTISVEKNAVDILAHAANDELRAVMMSVYVDFKYNNIVSSDGHTLQIMRCNISGNVPNIDGVVIPAHIAKRVLKERVFTLTIDGSHITCGNECFEDLGRYPAYLRVWIGFLNESDQFVKLAKNAWKSVRKQATTAMKNDGKYFVFRALSGENKITVDVWDSIDVEYKDGRILNTFTFDVENAVPVSFTKAFKIEHVLHFKDVESFQGLDHGRAMCMYGNNFAGLLMPNIIAGLKDDYILFVDDSKQKYFFPVDAWKIERETADTIPVETMEETANTIPVEGVKMWLFSTFAAVAACLIVFICLSIKPRTIATAATAAPTVATVAISEAAEIETINAADVVTIEAEINDVICTGSIDPYIEHVKEEITRNYRAVMASQLQEIADNNNEVFAAIEAADVEPVADEITPIYSESEELEEIADTLTGEDTDTADTITEDQSDTAESEGEIISYSCSGYTVLMMVTATPDGQPAINTYIESIE